MLFTLLPLFALPAAYAIDFTQWSPPGPGDVRSPCPALNTLANHGIINHNGKGISVPMLTNAMEQTFNIGPELRTVLAIGGLFASSNPLGGTVDLDELDRHNYIEHDGSLSRADFADGGDNYDFNQTIFDEYMSAYAGMNRTTLAASGRAKYMRVYNSSLDGPSKFTYGPKQYLISYGESSILLMGLGDPITATAPVSYLTTFFEQERLPWLEGWRPATTVIDFPAVGKIIPQLMNVSGEAVPEGTIVSTNSIAKVMLGLDLTDDIPPAVQNFLSKFGLGSIF